MAFIDDQLRRAQRAAFLARAGVPDVFIQTQPMPFEATPAAPLPGAPLDRPVIAPQSEQAIAPQPQAYNELAPIQALLQRAPRNFAPTGVKEIDERLAQAAAAQQTGAQNYLEALSGVQMDPRELAILQARRERAQKEQAELEKDQKTAGWDALARAGMAMAKSNSPYFMQALASGMEAGLQGLDEAELKRDEKRARLQAAEEDTILAEIRGKQSAQERAVNIYNAAIAAGKSETEARDMAIKSAVTSATLPQQLELADLEVAGKRADLKLTEARTIDALRPPRTGGSGGDGTSPGKPLPPGARAEAEGRLATAYEAQDEAYRKWVKAGKPILGQVAEGTKDWEAASTYEAARGKVNNILTTLGKRTLGPAPVRAGKRITQAQRNASPARAPARSGGTKPKSFPGTQAVWDAMTPEEKKLFQ